MAITKRLVLRSGFGIIIGLLVISTVMAYRVQESFSERSVELHRRFVNDQDVFTNLRRALYLSAIALRDHFINPNPDMSDLAAQMREFENNTDALLHQLGKTSGLDDRVAALESEFAALWSAVRTASQSKWNATEKFHFVQQEIVPRRDAAGKLLREIERANHTSLAESEQEYREMRTVATQRLLGVLAICLLCGILVAWFSTRHSEHLEQQAADRFQEVSRAKLELERLSARLMDVQEEERTRLSRELHDEIVQNLAVLKMEIVHSQAMAASQAPGMNDSLGRARKLAESTVQTVRNISLLLRPSLLDDLGLVPALQWQAEEFARRTGIQCDFEDDLTSDSFPDNVKTCVYRVTQEALRNCEKHSRASHVHVKIKQSGNWLQVKITDNGVGFPKSDTRIPTQLGVLGMRERAAALGGQLLSMNKPGGGAVVELVLPLVATREHPVSVQAEA